MSEDDVTGIRFYRVVFSHDWKGWCVYEQINGVNNSLKYVDGPWDTQQEAQDEMVLLNKKQGLNI
jgi:hypothetical protein